MAIMGRPQRQPIEKLQAKAWMADAKAAAGVTSAYALNLAVMGAGGVSPKRFEKYQRGSLSPSAGTLRDTESKFPGTKNVYLIGPRHNGAYVPLWKAISGSIEEVWNVLEWFDEAFVRSRMFGFRQSHRIDFLLAQMVNAGDQVVLPAGPDLTNLLHEGMGAFCEPAAGYQYPDFVTAQTDVWLFKPPVDLGHSQIDTTLENPITKLWAKGQLTFDLRILAATIALWRLSHFLGEGWHEMDALICGLVSAPGIKFVFDGQGAEIGQMMAFDAPSPVRTILDPLDIADDFLELIAAIWKQSVKKYSEVVHTMLV
jgi:hypothetical protein